MSNKEKEIAELKETLTHKQLVFCHEYIVDWNGTRAAKAAGYSEKTAFVIASENLNKPYIKTYISLIKDNLEEEAGISKLMAIKELKKFAFNGFEKIHNTWIEREEFESLSDDVKACISEVDTKVYKKNIGTNEEPDIVDVEHVRVKLVDKRGALQDLAKMMGWNKPEEVKHSGKIENDLSNLSTDELLKRAEAVKTIKNE